MRQQLSAGARWAILVALFGLAGLLPSTGGALLNPVASGARILARAMAAPNPSGGEVPSSQPPVVPQLVALVSRAGGGVPGPSTYVPVLYYHYIRVNPSPRDRLGFSLSVPPAMFRAQMQYLADHGFHVVRLHDAVMAILHHTPLPARPVVLTFDDGYADFYTQAIPVLLSHGFPATDFVISGRMGWGSYMTPAQVLAADRMGFTIGAHTVDHIALAGAPPALAAWEIRQSKATLEALLGHPVLDFAYPYGSYNAYDEAQVRRLGFEVGAATIGGSWHWPGQLMNLYRIRVSGGLPLYGYAHLVGGPPPTTAELAIAGGAVAPPAVSPPAQASATPSPTPQPSAPSPSPQPSAPSPSPQPTASRPTP